MPQVDANDDQTDEDIVMEDQTETARYVSGSVCQPLRFAFHIPQARLTMSPSAWS